ncbi:MAG TPA: OmpA family protein [Pyrinomonadaceae bacterium]|nr:OmpA family protein [Pyrinomonadaceae bacterium]
MSNRDDDSGDFNLTVPDIQPPGRGPRRPPQDDFERTSFDLPRASREPERPAPPTPPAQGNYDLTAVNFNVPPGAYDDDDSAQSRPRPAPPPSYAPRPYPPQQQPQYPQQQLPPLSYQQPQYQQPAYPPPTQYPHQEYARQQYAQPQYPAQPQTAVQPAAPQAETRERRVPGWAWGLGGLLAVVLVALLAAALYFFWPFGSTFTLRVLNAPRGSRVYVDDVPTGVSQADGSITVQSLRADEQREVRVTHEGYADWRTMVKGQRGELRELRVKLTPLDQKPVADDVEADIESLGRARIYVNFDTGSDVINPDSRPTLNKLVAVLKKRPDWKLTVEGHTDSTASAAFNQQLSERRAVAVKNYLQANGIEASRLSTVGFGMSKPISDNNTELGRALNRRVELIRQ